MIFVGARIERNSIRTCNNWQDLEIVAELILWKDFRNIIILKIKPKL